MPLVYGYYPRDPFPVRFDLPDGNTCWEKYYAYIDLIDEWEQRAFEQWKDAHLEEIRIRQERDPDVPAVIGAPGRHRLEVVQKHIENLKEVDKWDDELHLDWIEKVKGEYDDDRR